MTEERFNHTDEGTGPGDSENTSDHNRQQPQIKKVIFGQLQENPVAAKPKGIPAAFYPVNLKISAELGKMQLKVRELINLEESSVLRLNRAADEKVLILVNDTPFAHGEIVVINDRFGVRVTALVDKVEAEQNETNRRQEAPGE